MLTSFLLILLWAAWIPFAIMVAYLLMLAISAARSQQTPLVARKQRIFRVVIPAHNEALVLEPVLRRLQQVKYPGNRVEIVVVADNCTDTTAEVARSCGARVLERFDATDRGKGHALAYAFQALRPEAFDAYVVLDADTLVEPDLLAVLNHYLAQGQRVIQAHYDVLNPWETRRTTLMYVAFHIFNYVRPLGRRVLGLSTGLKGNGMCFAKPVIDHYTWNAYSLAEDIEYTTTLLQHGEHIAFAPEAHVAAQMPTARTQATSQRIRWEAGRLQLARRDGARLVAQGLHRLNAELFDWGMDLVIPPLAALTLAILGGTLVAVGITLILASPALVLVTGAWGALILGLLLFVGIAMRVGRMPLAAYQAMLSAPGFVLWKLWIYVLMALRPRPRSWVRTERSRIHDS